MSSSEAPASLASFVVTPKPLAGLNLFVDHKRTGRSGHIGHAMFQRQDGEIFAFYASCSSDDPGRHGTTGHSAAGWMELKRSKDAGKTWSKAVPLEYSKKAFASESGYSIFTEKAIVTDSGAVVLFHLLSDISQDALWEPYLVPTSTRSLDGGETWDEPVQVGADRGRVYGAAYASGTVYALKFRNDAEDDFCGTTDEHVYTLYVSRDEGVTFSPLADLPFDTRGRGYGTLCVLADGRMIAYVYNKNDEEYLDYTISADGGLSWTNPGRTFFAKRIRNPQMVAYGGGYFLHGRSGSYGPVEGKGHFVVYYSPNGIDWDEGTYFAMREHGQGAYSNSIVVRPLDPNSGERLYIHASHAYSADSTNIVSWWVDRV